MNNKHPVLKFQSAHSLGVMGREASLEKSDWFLYIPNNIYQHWQCEELILD